MKKTVICSVILLVIVYLFIGSQSGFYEYDVMDWDLYRLPLIKPYEVNSADRSNWEVSEDSPLNGYANTDRAMMGFSVDSVGLGKDVIVIYRVPSNSLDTLVQAWYVFDVKTKSSKAFTQKQAYTAFLQQSKQPFPIKLYTPEELFVNYSKSLTLPKEWVPYIEADKKERWWRFWD